MYRFHYSLALDEVGVWVFGAVALLWTLDCFVGAYLTLPPRGVRRTNTKSWLARWLPAWLLKTTKLFTLVFTWHRASGLWIWAILLIFAWSGVALNLHDQVYSPVMNAALGDRPEAEPKKPPVPRPTPQLDFRAALARGRSLMEHEARQRGFSIFAEQSLSYDAQHGAYTYTVDSSLDVDSRLAETMIAFDGDDGNQLLFFAPALATRSAVDQWLVGLHFGAVRALGLAYRVFVSIVGLLVALLSITGTWIWLRKRSKEIYKPS